VSRSARSRSARAGAHQPTLPAARPTRCAAPGRTAPKRFAAGADGPPRAALELDRDKEIAAWGAARRTHGDPRAPAEAGARRVADPTHRSKLASGLALLVRGPAEARHAPAASTLAVPTVSCEEPAALLPRQAARARASPSEPSSSSGRPTRAGRPSAARRAALRGAIPSEPACPTRRGSAARRRSRPSRDRLTAGLGEREAAPTPVAPRWHRH
jgi:hypothetical protein